MGFKPTAETPIRALPDGSGVTVVSGPGGCPWIVDPARPHLGGNFDGGDLGTQYPNDLWPWLLKTLAPQTVVDVGCGTGESMRWFAGAGCQVLGVEGLPWNAARCAERGAGKVILHDFEKDGPCVFDSVDLIWCADVAEHIAEEHVDDFIQTLRQCRVLAMCQGTEGNADEGWGHVNNQPESYWVAKLAAAGMLEDEALTAESRAVGCHGWWQGTGRIYRRLP